MADEPRAHANTDRELWRETPGDYYSPSIHVTKGGGIGINVGGTVIVRPVREWHAAMADRDELDRLRVQLAGCLTAAEGHTADPAKQGDYGWSPAYQAVLELRVKFDRLDAETPPMPPAEAQRIADDICKRGRREEREARAGRCLLKLCQSLGCPERHALTGDALNAAADWIKTLAAWYALTFRADAPAADVQQPACQTPTP